MAGLFGQLHQLGGTGGVRVLLVEVQNLLGKVLTAPLDMVFHVFLCKFAVLQGLLEDWAVEECLCFLTGLLPVLRFAGFLQGPRPLAEGFKFLVQLPDIQLICGNVGDLLQHPLPEDAIEEFGPAHEGGFQLQLLPSHLIELFRQLLPLEEVVDEPHPRRVALRRRGVSVLEVPEHVAVQDLPRLLQLPLCPAAFFRQPEKSPIVRETPGDRPLRALEGLYRRTAGGQLEQKLLPLKLGVLIDPETELRPLVL